MMERVKKLLHLKSEKGYINVFERAVPALVYLVIYLRWFSLLEDSRRSDYVEMHLDLDDMIPFVEVFVIPYYLWFVYVAATVAFLMFYRHAEDYYRALVFLCIGMTVFLAFSTLVPTMQTLRPAEMPRDNVFTRMIARLYMTDTPTNVFPSIHVYNSVGCMIALLRTKALEKHNAVRVLSVILSVSVILSTMFIKQHSVIDVAGALVLSFVVYRIVYQTDFIVNLFHIRERECYSYTGREHS